MKLRNKKTGEIAHPDRQFWEDSLKLVCEDTNKTYVVNTIAELNEEWEDHEEPKSGIEGIRLDDMISGRHIVEIDFTKVEEAEKAVEKLKAWKRLKEKCNFRFTGIERDKQGMLKGVKVSYDRKNATFDEAQKIMEGLYLLFGGEE